MSLWAILSQQLLRHWGPLSQQSPCLYDLYFQLLRYNATYCLNNYHSDPILQQLLCLHDLYLQLLRHYDLYCRNHYHATKAQYHSHYHVPMTHIYSSYVTMVHSVSTTITQALCYSNYYASMIYIYSSCVAIIYRTLLHSPINTNLCILFRPITTIMQQAMTTACPLLENPRRCAHQERLGGR